MEAPQSVREDTVAATRDIGYNPTHNLKFAHELLIFRIPKLSV